MNTTVAALPDHNRLTDPLWLKLFHRYWHVITPLRYLGWVTDVETGGGEFFIRADLGDGTELAISSNGSLPTDPADVTGWHVLRQSRENPDRHTVLYDSSPGGSQSHHGASLVPMFARIDALDVHKAASRLSTSATYSTPYGLNHNQSGGGETPGVAVARYFEWCQHLTTAEGYRRIWERPEREGYPLAVFERDGYVVTVRVTRSND
ncbi:hypothetical protein [Streptomyces sp. NPDC006140]|uniref:hypothetical protein n=1 Tax=Streptomyces sp. NPDC006140 TaxID=3154579 RepID=UPI0033F86A97